MNRTIVGRIAILRGLRHQGETFLRQATELGSWTVVAVPFWLFVFSRSYRNEQDRMRAERLRALKEEKAQFDRVERQLAREIGARAPAGRGIRRLLPRRVR